MADKQDRTQLIKEYTEKLEQGIREIFSSGRYEDYLRTMARFHQYSMRNTALIHLQRPDATLVAGYESWKRNFERHVNRGEKGIKIFVPAPIKTKQEVGTLDQNGNPVLDETGNPVSEEQEIILPNYKVVSVFDVTQTEGRPLPQVVENLDGEVHHYDLLRQALEETAPYPVRYAPLPDNVDGVMDFGNGVIRIREGMSQPQTIAALIHERSHGELHDDRPADITREERRGIRRREEVEAESVAYTVAQHFGIDTGANSFGYIATWSHGQELAELTASLETIKTATSRMITMVDARFDALKKENGLEPTIIEAEPVRVIPSEEASQDFSIDYRNYMDARAQETELPFYRAARTEQAIADATRAVMDGSGIQDARDTLDLLLSEHGEQSVAIGDKRITADSLLRRLRGMDKVEYVMPELDAQAIARPPTQAELDELAGQGAEAATTDRVEDDLPDANADQSPILPAAPEPVLQMPDPTITLAEMHEYGYAYGGMLPLQEERARELYEQDHAVYRLYPDDTEAMVTERAEFEKHDGIFGIETDDWAACRKVEAMKARNHETAQEVRLFDGEGDHYGVYQLTDAQPYRFEAFDKAAATMHRDHYRLVYIAPLPPGSTPESLYALHNAENRPAAQAMWSMSMSDVLVMRRGGTVTAQYVDRIGFQPIQGFLDRASHIRAAEMSTEQNHNMIDGVPNNTAPGNVETQSVANSNYQGMVALVGTDGNVYLGKEENYHHVSPFVLPWHKPDQEYGDQPQAWYDNADNSLISISGNDKMYTLLYAEGWAASQEEMVQNGAFTEADYQEFADLQAGVLSQFALVREILFDGQPFHPPAPPPTVAELEERVNAGQAISVFDLAAAIQREKPVAVQGDKKPSLLGRLEDGRAAVARQDKDSPKIVTPHKTEARLDE